MKKNLLALLMVFLAGIFIVRADYWTQMATCVAAGKELPITFSIGNKGYVGCGSGAFDFWEFDVAANLWTQKADVGGGVRRAGVGFSINDKGYATTGEVPLNDFWEYDTTANAWTQLPNFPGPGRSFAAAFVIGNKVYLGGGQSPFMQDLWEWDQTTQIWTQKANCLNVMTHQVAFALLGKGYWTTSCCSTDEMWEYDPLVDAWTQKATFPGGPRSDASGFAICDRGYLCTGGEGPYYNDLWQYDPLQNTWLQKASIPTVGRDDGAAFVVNGKGYYGFGQLGGSTSVSDLWEYTPDSSCAGLVAAFTADNHICPGTCTNFTNLSVNGSSFLWSFPGANPSTSIDVNPTNICYNTPGTYAVSLIATNAGGSDTLTLNNYITVYPFPAPQGIQQSGDTLIANQGAISYQWYHTGLAIPGATDYFYVATEGGDYNVVATDVNGCEVEAAIFDITAAVSNLFMGDGAGVRLYPNPVIDNLEIQSELFLNIPATIKLFSSKGELVFTEMLGADENRKQHMIDVSKFAPGLYWLNISTGSKTITKKFLIK
ncbi:MAG: T9SS type A sorting domain-containing protein [Bacteroidetes bacterium]|nr:T9SS type A sorting domain-containing protein [Bacteroidota bacterium]